MIPLDYITEWRKEVPWVEDAQVEQDLVISRALVDIFSHPLLHDSLAFRGGTALYKLHLKPAARYSEDIDLVQIIAEPAGPVLGAIREVLNPWLGEPKRKRSHGRVTLTYRFDSEGSPTLPLKLKVEINTREHFSVYGIVEQPFSVGSRWFEGACSIKSYELNELLGTKLRALYQRKKGRDLFDLAVALKHPETDADKIIETFRAYMEHGSHSVTQAQFEENLNEKREDRSFVSDIRPLLSSDYDWDLETMADSVMSELIYHL